MTSEQDVYVRKLDINMSEYYLAILKETAPDFSHYLNNKTFLLFVQKEKLEAKKVIENNLDIKEFLNSYPKDIADGDSVLMKNYASLLKKGELQKKIMKKCLEVTPYDVDLIQDYQDIYQKFDNNYFLSILRSGYIDLYVYKRCKIDKNDYELTFKLIVLCANTGNIKAARSILAATEIEEEKKSSLEKYLIRNDFIEQSIK